MILTEDKRQFARGKAKKITQPSPQRQQPRCIHFGVCGGCQQQHVSVALQQESKARALGRMLSQEAALPVQVDEIISAAPWAIAGARVSVCSGCRSSSACRWASVRRAVTI